MALTLSCPCGNPLDCNGLEVLVTVTCPRCSKEFGLEVQNEAGRRCFAVLTVMAGPYWVGEQFVMPVGETLYLGKAADNWLSFESDGLSDRHCKVFVSPRGRVEVESLGGESGVWINDACIMRGRLRPQESFTIGEYRLRLDYVDTIGGETLTEELIEDSSGALPTMSQVGYAGSPGLWIVRNRFVISRWAIAVFAWFTGAYHVLALTSLPAPRTWQIHWALVAGLAVLVPLLISGSRVTLVHRQGRYFSPSLLIVLAMVDVTVWQLPFPAVGALLLTASLCLLTLRLPSAGVALFAAVLCTASVVIAVVSLLSKASAILGG